VLAAILPQLGVPSLHRAQEEEMETEMGEGYMSDLVQQQQLQLLLIIAILLVLFLQKGGDPARQGRTHRVLQVHHAHHAHHAPTMC